MHDYPGDQQQTAELLAPGQAAIYPVSAAGLTGDATYEASHLSTPRMQQRNLQEESADRARNQIAMEELAKDTGCHAFYNSNGLGDAMVHAIHDGARYYTLGDAIASRATRREGRPPLESPRGPEAQSKWPGAFD
jgi:hypothetical protein